MSAQFSGSEGLDAKAQQNHARERETLRLEPHVCRVCFSRIASSKNSNGSRTYQCVNCGAEATGQRPDVVCACGIKLRKARGDGRSANSLVDAGIRCHKNEKVTPELPALYVASYGGAQAEG